MTGLGEIVAACGQNRRIEEIWRLKRKRVLQPDAPSNKKFQ